MNYIKVFWSLVLNFQANDANFANISIFNMLVLIIMQITAFKFIAQNKLDW